MLKDLINSFSIEGHLSFYDVSTKPESEALQAKTHRLRTIILFSPLKVNVSPMILTDLQVLALKLENFYIMHELRKFRPAEDLC